jgi:hypothetical protein
LKLPFSDYIKAHHITRAGLVMAGAGVAVVFFLVGAVVRLLVGPVSLGPFNSALSSAIQEALPGIAIQYDQPAVEWSREEGRVNLVILGVKMFDANGRVVAEAPKVDVDLAAAPLLELKTVVQRITLVGVQLTLVHMQDGSIRLGAEKDRAGGDVISRLNDIITAKSSSTSSLKSFAVRDANLTLMDEVTGLNISAPRANLSVETSGKNLRTLLDADIAISGSRSHINADLLIPPGSGDTMGTASMTGLDLRALAANSKNFAVAKDLALVANFSSNFVMAANGTFRRANFDMRASGSIPVVGLKSGSLRVKSLEAKGRYDGATQTAFVENAVLDADRTSGHLKGKMQFVYDADGVLQKIDSDFAADRITLNMPGVFASVTTLKSGQFKASFAPGSRDLIVEKFTLSDGPFIFNASGKITAPPELAPAIALRGTLQALPVRDFLRYWPMVWAAGSREWIDANVASGLIGPLNFETQIPEGALDADVLPDNAIHLTFPLSGAQITYVKGLTPMTEVRGTAVMTGDTFGAQIEGARIGPLAVTQGRFDIRQMHVPGTAGVVTARVEGGLPDVLRLIDMKPLGYPTRFGIDPAKTTGTAAVDLNVKVPMLRNLTVDDVGIGVRANVAGLSVSLGGSVHLTDGNILFAISNDNLRATGTGAIAGSRLNLDWTEDFRTQDPITTRVRAIGALGDDARKVLGFGLDDIVTGPASVDATITGNRGSLRAVDMSLNVSQTHIGLDMLGVEKPVGTAMTANANVVFAPGNLIQSTTFRLTGPNGGSAGNAGFDREGKLSTLAFSALRIGATDIALNMVRNNGVTDVIIRGRQLDGTRMAARGSNESSAAKADPVAATAGRVEEPSFKGPFHVNARVDRLMMREGMAIAPFALDVSGIDNRPSSFSLSGSPSRNASLTGVLMQTPQGRRITVSTTDAASLIKGLIGFSSLRGGNLDLTVNLPGPATDATPRDAKTPDYTGTLYMKDFRVMDQPALARLFAATSFVGFGNLLQGEGIAVDQMNIPISSKNGVISIDGARATGPAIGATADGYVDRPKNMIALKGSLVPAYGINGILNNVPIIGDILGGKKGEGIIAFTYNATGNADQPVISVNPLSALAPGFLRQLFQGSMPKAADAPSNAPAQAPATP